MCTPLADIMNFTGRYAMYTTGRYIVMHRISRHDMYTVPATLQILIETKSLVVLVVIVATFDDLRTRMRLRMRSINLFVSKHASTDLIAPNRRPNN